MEVVVEGLVAEEEDAVIVMVGRRLGPRACRWPELRSAATTSPMPESIHATASG